MALCGAYRRLASQISGRLRYAPLALASADKVFHTSAAAAIPPEPVPLPKLKDRFVLLLCIPVLHD